MNPERQRQVEDILQATLRHQPGERAAFLDEACSSDPSLRSEVESLLSSFDESIDRPDGETNDVLDESRPYTEREIGPYRLIGRLGRGGMGEVYLAEDPRLGRKLAIKLLPAHLTEDQNRIKRFQQEARAASALNHPNIITVYEVGQVGPVCFIATELVEGDTLRRRLSNGRMSLEDLLDVAIQVASAVASAHAAGIIHRDIKPENIMLRPDGYVKVLDFGLAKLHDQRPETTETEAPTIAAMNTDPGTVMGTVRYMSPEQARGLAVDARADVFSLGAVIYEMVSGRNPFEGDTAADVISSILLKEPPPLTEVSSDIPGELEGIVAKALRKDKERRYQTVNELLADLKALKRRLEFETERQRSDESISTRVTTAPDETAVATGPELQEPTSTSQPRYTVDSLIRGTSRRTKILAALAVVIVLVGVAAVYRLLARHQFQVPIREFTLSNGLRVVLSEDHSAPTFSICVTYRVGSRDEKPGRTGFAHLFEHMMFEGSENVGKGEHLILVSNNGGKANGQASWDDTQFYQTLPANQIDLGLFLEADRMRSLAINQANLDNQRRTVKEERRSMLDNQPYGQTSQAIFDTVYEDFAYKHSRFGSMEDLDATTVDQVKAFFETYYAPNNAVVSMVGDFNPDLVREKISKYFETIPPRAVPPQIEISEAVPAGERRKTIEDTFAQTPRIDLAYRVSAGNTDDWYALNLLAEVLGGGQSSRLYQRLVKEKEVAANAGSEILDLRGPGLVNFWVLARPGKDLGFIERALLEEIERVVAEPLDDSEVARARLRLRAKRARLLQSTLFRSTLLGRFAADYGEPQLLNTAWDKTDSLGGQQILRVARAYLTETRRAVVTTLPNPGPQPQPAPPTTQQLVTSSAAASEQNVETPSSVERKNKAPVSSEILRAKLPRVIETTLDNGLTVLILEDHRLPMVLATFRIGGSGALYEPGELPGLATTTAQMLREGTRSHTSKQLAEESERGGATLYSNAAFGGEATIISATGLSDNFDEWFALAAEMVVNPVFPADELNTLKQRQKVQLQFQQASPRFVAQQWLNRLVFDKHPAAAISPTVESINAMTPEILARWHREHYAPQTTMLGIAGDVSASELIPKLKKWVGSWPRTESQDALPPNPSPATSGEVLLVDRPGSVQSTIYVGKIAVNRWDPDYIPMVVMNRVLGDSPSSRFFRKLREEKGYSYGPSSSLVATRYAGPWVASMEVRSQVTDLALTDLLGEIRRMAEERVPDAELEEHRRAIAASFALSLEQPGELLNYALTRKFYGFSADYWDLYPAKVTGVSAEEIQRVARSYVNTGALKIVVVGEASRIGPGLARFGPLSVYGADGKLISGPAPSRIPQAGPTGKNSGNPK